MYGVPTSNYVCTAAADSHKRSRSLIKLYYYAYMSGECNFKTKKKLHH